MNSTVLSYLYLVLASSLRLCCFFFVLVVGAYRRTHTPGNRQPFRISAQPTHKQKTQNLPHCLVERQVPVHCRRRCCIASLVCGLEVQPFTVSPRIFLPRTGPKFTPAFCFFFLHRLKTFHAFSPEERLGTIFCGQPTRHLYLKPQQSHPRWETGRAAS